MNNIFHCLGQILGKHLVFFKQYMSEWHLHVAGTVELLTYFFLFLQNAAKNSEFFNLIFLQYNGKIQHP